MVGFAVWDWEPNYKNTIIIDCFCHQNYWVYAPALLAGLPLPRSTCEKFIVLADWDCQQKINLFASQGFQKKEIGYELPANAAKTRFTRMIYMEKQNVEYVPPTKEQEAMNAERLGMTQKEKVKKLLRQYKNLKTDDDLKNIVDVFDVSDEEAKHKVLSNDLKELVEKMKYLTSEGMPDAKDISAMTSRS